MQGQAVGRRGGGGRVLRLGTDPVTDRQPRKQGPNRQHLYIPVPGNRGWQKFVKGMKTIHQALATAIYLEKPVLCTEP